MSPPLFLMRDGHRTWLKWHRARRHGSDPVFTGRRIVEGMRMGASVEVDLVIHGDDGFAVLHDLDLDHDTTGQGPVRAARAAALRQMHLRDNQGRVLPDRVMLLEDLAALIAREGAHPEALLQLDYKEDEAALTPGVVATFARALAPVARHFILSSGDAGAVAALTGAVPGLRIGYDPCHRGAIERVRQTGDFAGFVAEAIAASPRAELVYLDFRLALGAAERGFDLIAAFQARGRRIDAYTIPRADAEGVAAAERLLAMRVDQITTDDPEGLGAALADG